MKDILKWPLIAAALAVVLRVVAERAGAPHFISASLSVAALITVLGPLYFAIRIGSAGTERPYLTLLKLVLIYAICARAMVLPTYWMARIYNWPEPRFAGLAGSSPFVGFVALPLLTAAFWIAASVILGGAVGAAALTMARARTKSA